MIRRLPQQTDSLLKNKVVLTQTCEGKDADTIKQNKQRRLLDLLADDSRWQPKYSRAIVFVTSRRKAEELAELINKQGVINGGKRLIAEAFHAGLAAEDKNDVYERFRLGGDYGIDVLCATNAFGMGMDVGNIHLVVHFGPPASLEDYIQEIGRAARSERALRDANLSAATACLLHAPSDFDHMRTRIHRDLLSDTDLQTLLAAVQSEFNRSTTQLPIDGTLELARLVRKCPGLSENKLRSGLYWLQRLRRIELGCYAPVSVAVTSARKLYLPLPLRDQERCRECLACFSNQQWPLLNAALNVMEEFFAPLLHGRRSEAQQLPYAKLQQLLADPCLDPSTYTWLDVDQRARWAKRDQDRLEHRGYAIVRLAVGFGICSAPERLHGGRITYEVRPRNRNWQTELRSLSQIVKNVLSFIVESQRFDEPAPVQASGAKGWSAAQNTEPSTQPGEVDGARLLQFVGQWTPGLRIHPRSIMAVLRFLRELGYIGHADTFFPLAYEATLQSVAALNLGDASSADGAVLAEMKEQARLRVWRLAALQAVPCLAQEAATLEGYLEAYFRTENVAAIEQVLETHGRQGNVQALDDILHRTRDEVFWEVVNEGKKEPLSDQQAQVCKASVDQDLLINAGPGAGKTKTLLARLAWLIHVQHESPDQILVLAFTRAVVDELRGRLRKIFDGLGYGSHVQKLAVHTFHSFALGELRRINQEKGVDQTDKDIDQPITLFVDTLTQNYGLRVGLANRYRYIFVDEFQDIHDARYDLLKLLAGAQGRHQKPPTNRTVRFVVALDDDQSIFDDNGRNGAADPRSYLDDFCSWAMPKEYFLTQNYRSAKQIVAASQDIVLGQMVGRLKGEPDNRLLSNREDEGVFKQVDFTGEQGDFADALVRTLVNEVRTISDDLRSQRKAGAAPKRGATIAILTPTNEEVYRIKRALQTALSPRNPEDPIFTYLVQGTESKFHMRRDVANLRDELLSDGLRTKSVSKQGLKSWLSDQLRQPKYRYWPGQQQHPEPNELWYLTKNFIDSAGADATFGDFASYLYEVGRHGDYLQIVAKEQAADGSAPIRILLSTIHRVKGLEFPAVILPGSEAQIRPHEVENALRVLYVGMTRAENTLVFVRSPRENALLNRHPFESRQLGSPNGLTVKPGENDLNISFFGMNDRRASVIENELMSGSHVRLIREDSDDRAGTPKYKLYLPNRNFYYGMLAGKAGTPADYLLKYFPETRRFVGLEVAGIYRRYAEQDKKPGRDGRPYYDNLDQKVKERGYYHIVEICGFVQPAP